MRKAHDWFWPEHIITFNDWTERRFQAHCEGYSIITMASGAGTGKSLDAAKIALIFWFSDPRGNACIITSTTLESLETRIWGYVAKFAQKAKERFPRIPANIMRSKPPKILHPGSVDKIHGMFAVAIKEGDGDQAISNVIGRHPDRRIMMVLDEATDMNAAVAQGFPNLERGVEFWQVIAIGNSNSKFDLHGALSTPLHGWKSINPDVDFAWQTNQKNGIALYFNPFDSPAIREKDPVKKAALSKFLITEETLKDAEIKYGKDSDSYWRFTLGFWKAESADNLAISEAFISENQVFNIAEWSGFHALQIVAGLDPAYQSGGSGCVLRLGVFGQTRLGKMCIDFRDKELLFYIDIKVNENQSAELQICKQVLEILHKYSCPLANLSIDCTGVGRALGELIRILDQTPTAPLKLVSVRPRTTDKKADVDPSITVVTPMEMWDKLREFIQQGHIRGIDELTGKQLINRLVIKKAERLLLESKKEYKARMIIVDPALATSPDEADALVLSVMSARLRLGFLPGDYRALPKVATSDMWILQAAQYGANPSPSMMIQQRQEIVNPARPPLVADFSSRLEDIPE